MRAAGRKAETTWRKGPPGWIIAILVTLNILLSWHLAGLGVAGYLALWAAAGTAMLSWSGTVVGLWLAYRVATANRRAQLTSLYNEVDPFVPTP